MTSNERPGVYSSYEVSSSLTGTGSRGTVGICAVSAENAGACLAVDSYAQAVAKYGAASSMTALIRTLFLNGVAGVHAVAVPEGAEASDYVAAFELLKLDSDITVMVCDSRDEAVFAAMRESILTAAEDQRFRIGIAELDAEPSELADAAAALNCERMVLLNAVDETPGKTAAAVAAAVASSGDPALPLSGAVLHGLTGGRSFSDGEVNSFVRSGVTAIENSGGEISVVRAVTTRTTTGGAADITWRELGTVLVIDDVIPTIKRSLRTKFSRSKNTEQTRGAIRTQVVIELESKLAREIIDSYGSVIVKPAEDDPTICEVEFEFAVAHGLNRIELKAHITV